MAKPYPLLTCARCRRTTGWLGAEGRCADCLRAAILHDAYVSPHAGWVRAVAPTRPHAEPAPPLAARAAAVFGRHGRLDRAIVLAWTQHVEPGDTGPVVPRPGYELEVPTKADERAPDGSCLLVRFRAVRYRFDGERWQALVGSKLDPQTPSVFAADLDIGALAEAWADFRAEVAEFDRQAWAEQAAREEAAERQVERVRDERGAAGLLPD